MNNFKIKLQNDDVMLSENSILVNMFKTPVKLFIYT